ncbi:MAG: ISNCY family transposase [Verrucomicrobiota bacterium]|nr:ISNCY family transposase [Verrucomicrobiota bacterium]
MSKKERERLGVLAGVKRGELNLVQASPLLGLSYRQIKRVWRRYQDQGDAGLVHRLRGRASARGKPGAMRAQVLALYAQERYAGFGPTLFAEHLERQRIVVDHETVRRWLMADGQWTVGRRRQRHRQWRERKASFGEMVQLDGSHHDWFEGRRGPCVLMVMVDDASNRLWAQFFEEETTHASYNVLEGWVKKHGLPGSLYVDRDSIYRCEGQPRLAEQLAGQEAPQTQFGRAMAQLDVKLILANSPQAKGRVERMNGVLQDRLVKELRLAGISDLKSANQFLVKYLAGFNRRFEREPASALDAHRAAPRQLNEILSWEAERVVQADWTVACGGKWYQLDRQHEAMSLVRRKVIVRTLRQGREQIVYGGQKLKWRALPGRPLRVMARKPVAAVKVVTVPGVEHPWRRLGMAVGREYWRGVKAQGRAVRAAARLGLRDSGRPPLRSGLSASRSPNRENKQPTTTRGHFLVS